MAPAIKFSDPIDREICESHRPYAAAMEELGLATFARETKQKCLQILRSVTEKLALASKPLAEIVG